MHYTSGKLANAGHGDLGVERSGKPQNNSANENRRTASIVHFFCWVFFFFFFALSIVLTYRLVRTGHAVTNVT